MPYTPDQFSNFATSTVAGGAGGRGAPLNAGDTTCYLPTGDGARFPAVAPFSVLLGAGEIARCTARASDTLTLQRGQEGTAAQSYPVGTTVQQVVSASSFSDLWNAINLGRSYSVRDYGAKGDVVTDDTAAIQAAINACQGAGGGVVYFPAGVYKTSAALVLTSDRMILRGDGYASVIQPVNGATFDVISTPIPGAAGTNGYTRQYVGVERLKIDCSNMSGTVAGRGNAIHFYGAQYSSIRDVWVLNCKNWAILFDGDGTNFSYNNQVWWCIFDQCNAGVWVTYSEANDIIENQFKWAGAACAAPQPAFGAQDTLAYQLRGDSGMLYAAGNIFGNGGAYTTEAVHLSNIAARIIGNRFDNTRYQAIVANGGGHMIIGNQFAAVGNANTGVPGVQLGSSNNIVQGNVFDNSIGVTKANYCVAESGGPFAGNTIIGNSLVQGTAGAISLNPTSVDRVANNPGYNPRGALAAPAIPASGAALTNTFGVDATVYIAGGTVSAIAVNGTTLGVTSGPVRVLAGQTITLTYSVAPAWVWMGE